MIIFFRNLSPVTSFDEIKNYFETFGGIGEISISTYVLKGKSKCFGQVEMICKKHGLAVYTDLQEKIFDGNKLNGNILSIKESALSA